MQINDLSDFFEMFRELKLDQDFMKYEEKQYLDNPKIMESLTKWRKILKSSDTHFRDVKRKIKNIKNTAIN